MIWLDYINAAFEAAAGVFVLNHCRVLLRDRETRGVSIVSTAFFMVWGFWNVFYYPTLQQPFSAAAGVFVAVANAIYIGLMVHFKREVKPAPMPKVVKQWATGGEVTPGTTYGVPHMAEAICLRRLIPHQGEAHGPRDEHETHHC